MSLVPLHERELRLAINKMFLTFPCREKDRGVKLDAYCDALVRIPISFVKAACDAAIRGKFGTGGWAPTAAQLAQYAEELQWRDTKRHLPRSRPEPTVIVSKEERLRVVHGFKELMHQLRSGIPIDPHRITYKVFKQEEQA